MTQPNLYEAQLKEEGMAQAVRKHSYVLEQARLIAIYCYKKFDGWEDVTVDDIRQEFEVRGIEWEPGNWAGSIFKDGNWLHVGYRPSTHEGSHARIVSVWRLKVGR